MDALLRDVVRSLVAEPDKVVIQQHVGEAITMLEISTGPNDAGKVIGKGGLTISSLRHLFSCIARNRKTRVSIQVKDIIRTQNEKDNT